MPQTLLMRPLKFFRTLSLLIAVMTCLPLQLRAEDYDIMVGGVAVSSDNANNIFDSSYPSACYDHTTNTLMLNVLSFVDPVESFVSVGRGIETLTVRLTGYNLIGMNVTGLFSAAAACTIHLITEDALPGRLEFYGDYVTDDNVTLDFSDSGLFLTEYNSILPIDDEGVNLFGSTQFHDGTDGESGVEGYPCFDYSNPMWYYSDAFMTDENSNLPPTVVSREGADGYVSRMRTSGWDILRSLTFQALLVESETPIYVTLMSHDGKTTYAEGVLNDGPVVLKPNALVTLDDFCLVFSSEQPFMFVPVAVRMALVNTYEMDVYFDDCEWVTYSAPADLEVPVGLEAYIVTDVDDQGVSVEQIGYLPQGVGVLLHKTPEVVDYYSSSDYTGTTEEFDNNLLVATEDTVWVSGLIADEATVYVLYHDSFVRTTRGTIPAGRCYLPVYSFVAESRLPIHVDDETTNISEQVMAQGHPSPAYYNLNGQRIKPLSKGLSIIKGKKVIK